MHRNHPFAWTALLLAVLLIVPACSDDDDPAAPTNPGDPPTIDLGAVEDFEPPAAMLDSSDPMAQEIVGYLARMDWVTSRLDRLVPPPAKTATKAGPWVYTWTEGEPGYNELTYTLTIRELADRRTWELRSSGTWYEVVLTNYLNLAAQVAKDNSWAWLEEYDAFGAGELQNRWSWALAGSAVTFTVDVHDMFAPYRIVVVLNLDHSGTMNYEKGTPGAGWLWMESSWSADGAGTWTEFAAEGGVVDSGSWGGPTQ